MKLYEIAPEKKYRKSKRKGRGVGSGRGKTSGKGHKGQKARSGAKGGGFEGGQMPLMRRIPKRGFTNVYNIKYQLVNVSDLNRLTKEVSVTPKIMKKKGLIKNAASPVKVLGYGELKKKFNVSAHAFSKSAKEKIEKAGGAVEIVGKA
ncbi:MAG: 50S ribosomal protein L15 [Candidatus Omnitrophica bacterium CG1_02_49_10]|nr:MAG: 50S ribosomal protein L15 [Candidatus Omnitrophica bacterium CG1_02_49_10]